MTAAWIWGVRSAGSFRSADLDIKATSASSSSKTACAEARGMYSNMISSFRTDSDILKRVEVIKGASSVLHGSGAIGGIVNMQTKSASDYLTRAKA